MHMGSLGQMEIEEALVCGSMGRSGQMETVEAPVCGRDQGASVNSLLISLLSRGTEWLRRAGVLTCSLTTLPPGHFHKTNQCLHPEAPSLPGPALSGQPAPGAQVAIIGNPNPPSAHTSAGVGQGNRARRAQ